MVRVIWFIEGGGDIYTLTGHFIRYTLLVPGWTPLLPSELL